MKFLVYFFSAFLIKLTVSQLDVNLGGFNSDVEILKSFPPLKIEGTIQRLITCNFEREGSQVCDCGFVNEKMILPRFSGNIFQIILLNCKILRIPEHSFADLPKLSWVKIHNVEDLILEEYSMQFSTAARNIKLEFINTVIEQFSSHSVSGNIEQIRFEKSRIGVFQPFSITSIRNSLLRLGIVNTKINNVEPQAFKKFSVEDFEIINSIFLSDLPSRSFYEIEVTQNLRLRNTTFAKVYSSAFIFHEVSSFTMTNNFFQQLNGESFQMRIRDSINIRDNNFGFFSSDSFQSITLERNYFSRHSEPMPLNFIGNHITMIDGVKSITFNEKFNLRLSQIYYENLLTCKLTEDLKENKFLKTHEDTIYFRMSDQLESNDNKHDYLTFSYILNHRCVEKSMLIYIIIGVSIGILFLFFILIIIVIIYVKRRRAKKLHIVQPDGKTYRETQIVMQIENHGLLKTDL